MLAFLVLKDVELKRIYDSHGFSKLLKSEEYSQFPVYEKDPYFEYDKFFEGICPKDREFLLLNGPNAFESEPEEEPEKPEEEEQKEEEGKGKDEMDEIESDGEQPEVVVGDEELAKAQKITQSKEVELPKPPSNLAAYSLRFEGNKLAKQREQGNKTTTADVWKTDLSKLNPST